MAATAATQFLACVSRRMAGCAAVAAIAAALLAGSSAASAQSPDRALLWRVVQLCTANVRITGAAFPCLAVDLARGVEAGFAVVRAPLDTTHVVAVPTAKVEGVESPKLQAADAPPYFADAWKARRFVEARAPRPLARDELGLAVNSLPGRSQDQLHIHVDCLRSGVRAALRAHAGAIGTQWARFPIRLEGDQYWAMKVRSADLTDVNPFRLAVEGLHVPDADRAKLTIVAAGTMLDGEPGFVLLAAIALMTPRGHRAQGHGEFLLDNSCTGR